MGGIRHSRHTAVAWGATSVLVLAAAGATVVVASTGAPTPYVVTGGGFVVALAVVTYRSGGRFEFDAMGARPLDGRHPPELRNALLDVCERAGVAVPQTVVVRMDVPGARAGYDDGDPVLAVDPRLPTIVGPEGMRALVAHELGHFRVDLHADAVRKHLPTVVGFGVFWTGFLAGRGPTVATVGTVGYLVIALTEDSRVLAVRVAASLGVEAVAVAVSRFANRAEEFRADAYAASLVGPATTTEALFRLAAVATGDNDEDVAGPVPWNADRSLAFAVFATHPTVEDRAAALGCAVPAWVRPVRPHRPQNDG